jgi:hypothetical protein
VSATGGGGATGAAPVDPGLDVDGLRAGIDGVREHLRRFGAAFGGVATAVLGGLGYATIHELFPAPAGSEWLYWLAAAAAVAAVGGAVVLVGRFFAGQRRILLTTRLTSKYQHRQFALSKREAVAALAVLQDHANEEGAKDLEALEWRALRLERIARSVDPDEAAALEDEAIRLHDVVRVALVRAVAAVAERRAQNAFSGTATKLAVAFAAAGVIVLWGAADYSKGQRDLIELREKCAKAVKEGAVTACEPVVAEAEREMIQAKLDADKAQAQRAERRAAAQALRNLTAADRAVGATGRAAVRRARSCATIVARRLKGQPETVQAEAITACVRGA